jgi:exodeoxyribonuclease VII small subunit
MRKNTNKDELQEDYQPKTYEEAVCELEDIVRKLEKGELSLEESIDCFQKGIELSRYCSGRLDEAERRIRLLVENEKGELSEQDMPEV